MESLHWQLTSLASALKSFVTERYHHIILLLQRIAVKFKHVGRENPISSIFINLGPKEQSFPCLTQTFRVTRPAPNACPVFDQPSTKLMCLQPLPMKVEASNACALHPQLATRMSCQDASHLLLLDLIYNFISTRRFIGRVCEKKYDACILFCTPCVLEVICAM